MPIFVFIDLAYLQTAFKPSFQQDPADHQVALKVITYVGCALSLVGEALTAVAYCVLKGKALRTRLLIIPFM